MQFPPGVGDSAEQIPACSNSGNGNQSSGMALGQGTVTCLGLIEAVAQILQFFGQGRHLLQHLCIPQLCQHPLCQRGGSLGRPAAGSRHVRASAYKTSRAGPRQHRTARSGGREQGRSESRPFGMAVNADHVVGVLWLPLCALPGNDCRLIGVPFLIQHTLDCSPHGRCDLGCVIIDDLILQHRHQPYCLQLSSPGCSCGLTRLHSAVLYHSHKTLAGDSTCSRSSPASHRRQTMDNPQGPSHRSADLSV